ncbi:gastrula zinc finger protein XlCGF57.1-like [Planococcus citri]|uniref:gastrula zinc finger protein XlCGF57.1-like n=1 Tax=Planococcus citri TaxID=170843 RepID=UPI0031F7ADEF
MSFLRRIHIENNDKDFFCATCKKTFSQELTYQEHLNIHSGKRPFSCKLCTASFSARQRLNVHLRQIHSDKQFKCPTCNYVAKHKGKLIAHIRCVHVKPFTCAICGYKAGSKSHIRQHITNQHTPASWTLKKNTKKSDNRLFCTICKKTFPHELDYQEHLNVHSGKRPFSCKLCTASFSARQGLNVHLRQVHSDKQFKCPTCDHVAKHKGKLMQHIKCVHDKPFTCDTCGYRTGEKGKLQHHIGSKHSLTMSFVCEVCGKGFGTNTSMQIHMRNMHFPEPRVCQICGTVCPSYSKYNAHRFKCGKEKQKYECEKCGQKYNNPEVLGKNAMYFLYSALVKGILIMISLKSASFGPDFEIVIFYASTGPLLFKIVRFIQNFFPMPITVAHLFVLLSLLGVGTQLKHLRNAMLKRNAHIELELEENGGIRTMG